MALRRTWQSYDSTYRAEQMETLAGWILRGVSGAVVGMDGAGKSNFIGFLCHRPEIIRSYLPSEADSVALIPVDLNNLPPNALSTFYRVILRSFYEVRSRFEATLQQNITTLYLENRATRDPFLSHSALRELLLHFQVEGVQIVLVMDHFDDFCESATPQMIATLRGLRDSFKDTLSYIVSTRKEVVYLADPNILGKLYQILDTHVCWVGPMNESDAKRVISQEMQWSPTPLSEAEISHLLTHIGGYPALLKAVCHWWLTTPDQPELNFIENPSALIHTLLAERSIQSRLEEISAGLTQEEQLVLYEVQKLQTSDQKTEKARAKDWAGLRKQHSQALKRLEAKGVCLRQQAGWHIFSDLFAAYIANIKRPGRGKIWLNEKTGTLYQGQTLLEKLPPTREALLRFLVTHPYSRHTKTDLIVNAWPDDTRQYGISDDSLFQAVRALRQKMEPNPAKPVYIVTWRGKPEGGYQFFPEGQPKA
ncbi:MAG: winged helix-turn-helix domain-containing protein [Ardenticatenaceae bacterium]